MMQCGVADRRRPGSESRAALYAAALVVLPGVPRVAAQVAGPTPDDDAEAQVAAPAQEEVGAEARAPTPVENAGEVQTASPELEASTANVAATSLADLVEDAREHWPGLEAAAHAVEAADARLDEAIFSPFFQFQATGGLTLAPEARGVPIYSPDSQLPLGNPWRPIASIGVRGALPLYTFGKLSGARDAARAGLDAAEHGRDRADAELVYRVRRAYYALQLALDTLQMFREGEGRLQRAVEVLERRIEAGDPDANEHDRWRLSTTVAEIAARRSEAQRLEASSQAALVILTGRREVRVAECPLAPIEVEPEPLESYRTAAIANRPDLAMLESALRARRAEQDVVEAQYFPDLALGITASYSRGPGVTDQSNPFIVDPANYQSLGAGLVLNWSLDFVGNRMRERRANAQLREAEARAEEARAGVSLEVETTLRTLEDAQRREEAWRQGHRDARSWFVAAGSAYQVGALDARDLVDAIRTYFSARFNHLSAIRDYNDSAAKLEQVVGSPVAAPRAWEYGCEIASVE